MSQTDAEAVIKDYILSKSHLIFFIIILVCNAIWLSFSPIDVDIKSYMPAFLIIGLGGILYLFYRFKRQDFKIMTLLSAALFFLIATNILSITSYLMTSIVFPLQDVALNGFDHLLGFNFENTVLALNHYPWLIKILSLFYHSSIGQMILIVILLSAMMPEKLAEFCRLYLIVISITFVIAMFYPAIGAYEYLQISPELLDNFDPNVGRIHIEPLLRLRENNGFLVSFSNITGLVSFPSFHTSLAILITYSLRDIKWVFPFAIVANIIVLIATVPIGGHYLTDILAGIVLTSAAIFFTKKPDLNE